MRIGRTRYRMKSPWRLGLFAALLIALGYFAVTSCGGSGDDLALQLAEPAVVPCYADCDTDEPVPYTFPFASDVERETFEAAAYEVSRASEISDDYLGARGVPIAMNLYIPASSTSTDPNSFRSDGAVYVPAVPLPSNDPAFFAEVVKTDGQDQEMVTLGFAADQVPSASFIRVHGFVYWATDQMNPNFDPEVATAQAVVVVGSWQEMPASQLRAPAVRTWPQVETSTIPIVVMRRGNLRMAVDRVEFAPDETRVHLNVRNLSPTEGATYDTTNASLITGDGEVLGVVEQDENMSDALDTVSLPAGAAADKRLSRRGYLVFPPVPATDALIVSLPDLNGTDTLRIEVPAASAGE